MPREPPGRRSETPPPEVRRRAQLRRSFGRQGAIRATEAVVGGFLFLLIVQNLLGFDVFDPTFWGAFQHTLWQGFAGTLYYTAVVVPLGAGIGVAAGGAGPSPDRSPSWAGSLVLGLPLAGPPR